MNDWTVALIVAGAQFAATMGGVIAAVRFLERGIVEAKTSAHEAHARFDEHISWHLQEHRS